MSKPYAYYNEIDDKAATWLRWLIASKQIMQGDVDVRPIEDVTPADLAGYTQHHFFAGIGVWPYALRRAGWPDWRPVATGSCPCQPLSSAGKGLGFADERHLWPAFYHLIAQCRFERVYGEQVASKIADEWVDLIHADLEALDYAFGCVPFPAASVGAPHIRDRNYWMADATGAGRERRPGETGDGRGAPRLEPQRLCAAVGMGHHQGLEGQRGGYQTEGRRFGAARPAAETGELGGLADTDGRDASTERQQCSGEQRQQQANGEPSFGLADTEIPGRGERGTHLGGRGERSAPEGMEQRPGGGGVLGGPGPTNGIWRAADWLHCRDGKWRPVETSPQPLANGIAPSLGCVRNQSVSQLQEEIDAWSMETQSHRGSALRALQSGLSAQAPRVWAAGGLPGLHEAPFLLAFMCQLSEQGWQVPEGVALSCTEGAQQRVRLLWGDGSASSSPRERGLDGQPSEEPADPLHILSSILARAAHSAWADAYSAYAEIGFPLGRGSVGRVPRLRGYGNAINAEQAAAFIAATMDLPFEMGLDLI